MIDVILAGGEVFDGSGRKSFRADIGIRDGQIACIGDLSEIQPIERIELNGLAVSPGFVDLHTHSDFTLLVNGRAESQVHQGVTTEAVGQCGHSCAPVARAGDARHGAIGYSEDCAVDMGWPELRRLPGTPRLQRAGRERGRLRRTRRDSQGRHGRRAAHAEHRRDEAHGRAARRGVRPGCVRLLDRTGVLARKHLRTRAHHSVVRSRRKPRPVVRDPRAQSRRVLRPRLRRSVVHRPQRLPYACRSRTSSRSTALRRTRWSTAWR